MDQDARRGRFAPAAEGGGGRQAGGGGEQAEGDDGLGRGQGRAGRLEAGEDSKVRPLLILHQIEVLSVKDGEGVGLVDCCDGKKG